MSRDLIDAGRRGPLARNERHGRGSGGSFRRSARRALRFLVACCATVAFSASKPEAGIGSASGVTEISPPPSVDVGALESDVEMHVFLERPNVLLASPLDVDIASEGTYGPDGLTTGQIPAGTRINSYLLHADQEDLSSVVTLTGSVTFDEDVLGVIVSDGLLDASDSALGAPGTVYPTGTTWRGLVTTNEDIVGWSGRTVTATFPVHHVTDQIRIIAVAAPPVRRVTFSKDVQGPPLMATFPAGYAITEGDILTVGVPGPPGPNAPAFGPLPPPGVEIVAGPGIPGTIRGLGLVAPHEVDALSYGRDRGDALRFSVDELAQGLPGGAPPDVNSEAMGQQASADAFTYLGPVNWTPAGVVNGNRAYIDGDGVAPSGRPGVGLMEPNPEGHDVDAMDLDTRSVYLSQAVFFSLDTASAAANPVAGAPVSGAHVLVKAPGPAPAAVFILANQLGLDLQGPGTDDLDALVLRVDGDQQFQPEGEIDPEGQGDMILFSVRRGSAVIGQPDSRLGLPIEEGDVLTPPVGGGVTPAIYIPAEALGLATARMDQQPDDLDALDVLRKGPALPDNGPNDPEQPVFLRGDVDGNGLLEITDPINSLSYQFLGSSPPSCRDTLDYDDNGNVELTDVVGSLVHLFLGGPGPADPGMSSCGVDPTPDDLDCEYFEGCKAQ